MMANGKNAGRLFADCYGRHGYGESHMIGQRDGTPIPADWPEDQVLEVQCMSECKGRFLLLGQTLVPEGDSSPVFHGLNTEQLDRLLVDVRMRSGNTWPYAPDGRVRRVEAEYIRRGLSLPERRYLNA